MVEDVSGICGQLSGPDRRARQRPRRRLLHPPAPRPGQAPRPGPAPRHRPRRYPQPPGDHCGCVNLYPTAREVQPGQEIDGLTAVIVVEQRRRYEWTRVADDHPERPNPSARISSARAAVSLRSAAATPNHVGGQGRSDTGPRWRTHVGERRRDLFVRQVLDQAVQLVALDTHDFIVRNDVACAAIVTSCVPRWPNGHRGTTRGRRGRSSDGFRQTSPVTSPAQGRPAGRLEAEDGG